MRYNLGCSLSYKIGSDATFIFNLEVARIASQRILKESLVLTPPIERSVYAAPATHNRYSGSLLLRACLLLSTTPTWNF